MTSKSTEKIPSLVQNQTIVTTATSTTSATSATNVITNQSPQNIQIRYKNLTGNDVVSKSPLKQNNQNDYNEMERKCNNPNCSAPTLISLVPTKKTPEFIRNPHVISNPVIVNGYTTVFQVDGTTVKLNEAVGKSTDGKLNQSNNSVYRIVPNTHAHIVNYVIVDSEGETLRKVKENDPITMKKLLDSQTNSANQLLRKLLELKDTEEKTVTQCGPMSTVVTTSTSTSVPVMGMNIVGMPVTKITTKPTSIPGQMPVQIPIQMPVQVPIVTAPTTKIVQSIQNAPNMTQIINSGVQVPIQVPITISPASVPSLVSSVPINTVPVIGPSGVTM